MRTSYKTSSTKEYKSHYLALSLSAVRAEEGRSQEFIRADLVREAARGEKRQEHVEIDREEEREERIQGED